VLYIEIIVVFETCTDRAVQAWEGANSFFVKVGVFLCVQYSSRCTGRVVRAVRNFQNSFRSVASRSVQIALYRTGANSFLVNCPVLRR
jgi:hypothetical protein